MKRFHEDSIDDITPEEISELSRTMESDKQFDAFLDSLPEKARREYDSYVYCTTGTKIANLMKSRRERLEKEGKEPDEHYGCCNSC